MPEKKQDGRYDALKSDMVSRLQSSMKRNRKIIWLDEVMFSKTSALTHAWSKRLKNVQVPIETINAKYTAVIASISEGCGVELFELYDSAVDSETFCYYLMKLS